MEVTFMRHGRTDLNGKGYIATKKDYSLNRIGIEQCSANVFLPGNFDCVYCSPYKRTIETAKIVYPYLNPIISVNLAQRDLGELNEKLKKDYDAEYLNLVREYILNPQNAETLQSIINRIDLFLEYIYSHHNNNSQLLAITHNGIMRVIKKYYLNENDNIDSENLGQFKMVLKKFE